MSKDHEASGVRLDHLVDYLLQFVAPHAGQNDDRFHVGLIHNLEHMLGWHVLVDVQCIVHVVVNVHHVVLGAVHVVHGGVQHRNRLKVLQQKGLLLFGIGGGLVANLPLRRVLLWGGALRGRPR